MSRRKKVLGLLMALSLIHIYSDQNLNNVINTMLAILFFANVLLCIWKNVDRKEGISMCILYLSSGAVAAPLLAANPIGARCF